MPRGTPWGDTSRLAGTRIGCGAPGVATTQRLQPRCTVCSGRRTHPSRACGPRSGPSSAGGAPGGPPRRRPGGRPARSSRAESSHLYRTGEAVHWASSSLHPELGPRRLSRARVPLSGRGLHREGGSPGGMSAGDSAAQGGQQQTAPTTVSNPCASRPARTEAPVVDPSSASAALASVEPAARRSFLKMNLTPRTPGWHPDAQLRGHPTYAGTVQLEEVLWLEHNHWSHSCHQPGP